MSDPVKITTHRTDGLSVLAQQYRDKKQVLDKLGRLYDRIQIIEDAAFTLYTDRSVDTAVGVQLDDLGKTVGERRQGALDPEYRLRVKGRIVCNRSSGTVENIIAVFRALLSTSTGYSFIIQDFYPAGFIFIISGIVTPASYVLIYQLFLKQLRGAAIQAWLGWEPAVTDDLFTLALSSNLSVAAMAGDGLVTVHNTSAFPATGTVIIDPDSPDEETVVYTSKTATTLNGFTLANPHPLRTVVELTPSPGKGLGDVINPAIGGVLTGIIVA
jgi:hypothetical protein